MGLLLSPALWAQEARASDPAHDAGTPEARQNASPPEAPHEVHPGPGAHAEHARMVAAMKGPLDIPLRQRASGTAWQPASTPMYGNMWLAGNWSLMLHYSLFAGLDAQGSDRGATQFVSTNWVMGMAQHPLFGGQFTGRAMLSLEPLVLGSRGYPLLLQTGETSGGLPLVDRQHPHDLFMEVAVLYDRAISKDLGFQLYVAPSGEPALGPIGFPHRTSAMSDPLAPLSHHWQDSTHILFGVMTGAVYTRFLKLEASWFNGREPDENRYDLDLRVPDSYSFRLSVNPTANWSGQISYGFLKEPELALEPGVSVHRLTASMVYNRRLASGGNWATTAAWGQNRSSHGGPSNAILIETNVLFANHNVFGRAEYVVKNGHDLALEGPEEEETFHVGAVALGYVRDFGPFAGLVPGIGVRGALNVVPSNLAERYGARFPIGGMVFLRLRPAEMMPGS